MGKKRIGLIVAALWAVTGLSAQNYQCAVGVRGGVTATGLSVRYHFDPVNALEGMLDFAQGFNIYALYERTIPVIGEGFESDASCSTTGRGRTWGRGITTTASSRSA